MPVFISFLTDDDFNPRYYGSPQFYKSAKGYTSFSVMPGFKYYPAAKGGVVRYSTGVSLITMFGKEPYFVYDRNSMSQEDTHYSVYGVMWPNTINVSINRHIEASFDMN